METLFLLKHLSQIQLFKTYIFDLVLEVSSDSSDEFAQETYLQPEGVLITIGQNCIVSSSATEISSMQQYTDQLSVMASVSGGAIEGSFSASGEYQSMQQAFSSQQSSGYMMGGNCTFYQATATSLPALNKHFIEAALSINSSDPTSYYDFFDTYGTHYVTDITMGAKINMISTFTASSVNSLESQGISVAAAAQASFGINFGISGNYTSDSSQTSAFSEAASYTEITSVACSLSDNALAWDENISTPLPISYKLSNISDLFTIENFGNSTDEISLSEIATGLVSALETYYAYLQSTGAILQVNTSQPVIPTYVARCLSCGGGLPYQVTVSNQVYIKDYDFEFYQENCATPLIPLSIETSASTYFCSNVEMEPCQLCASCGGYYPNNMEELAVSSSISSSWDGSAIPYSFEIPGEQCGATISVTVSDASDFDPYNVNLCCP